MRGPVWAALLLLLLESCAPAPAPPSSRTFSVRDLPALSEIVHWLYLLDSELEPPLVDQIAASAHDLVVIDFVTSQEGNADYPLAEVIEGWHGAPHPKLVLAYASIGEAESYRSYWQPGWQVGAPAWIVGEDPDGWAENYPIAFWHPVWQEIWLGAGGYVEQIVAAGFDGIYLDWVGAYEEEPVRRLAEAEGRDARQEMIRWVAALAERGRALRPGFLVVAQNAPELAESDAYARAIDALAQEHVWFDGGIDNDPPGDCPLPRTAADVGHPAYRASLTRACRRQYDAYPEGTLHASSEYFLGPLLAAQEKGLVILTVDYALDPANAAWVQETARALGFVPFVGSRALDGYVAP